MFPTMTEAEYRKKLATVGGRAFLFYGEEDYLKQVAVRLTREALCPDAAFAFFNDITLDALDYTADKLMDAMMPPPMMAEHRLILLRGMDMGALKPSELEALTDTLLKLPDYDYNTVIVEVPAGLIDEGYSAKRPSTVLKKLAEVLTPVHFAASTEAKLISWAGRHFAHFGMTVTPADCAFLVNYVGHSMFLLSSEIEKLSYYAKEKGKTAITPADIEAVAVPSFSVDTFAFSNAILEGRGKDALKALSVMKFERVPPPIILAEIARTLSDMQNVRILMDCGKGKGDIAALLKLHEYKVGLLMRAVGKTDLARLLHALDLTAKADASLKRGGVSYAPIEKLVCALS